MFVFVHKYLKFYLFEQWSSHDEQIRLAMRLFSSDNNTDIDKILKASANHSGCSNVSGSKAGHVSKASRALNEKLLRKPTKLKKQKFHK